MIDVRQPLQLPSGASTTVLAGGIMPYVLEQLAPQQERRPTT